MSNEVSFGLTASTDRIRPMSALGRQYHPMAEAKILVWRVSSPTSAQLADAAMTPPRGWSTDHAEAGGRSSMGVVLDWLAAPGNYARWRRAGSRGSPSRLQLGAEVVSQLRAAGIAHRRPADVSAKICALERCFLQATVCLRAARRAQREAPGAPADRQLLRALRLHSRYFALLRPVMGQAADVDADADAVVDAKAGASEQPARPKKKRPLLSTRRKAAAKPRSEPPRPRPARKPPAERRTTPPRACNAPRPTRLWTDSALEEKYRPPPKKPRRLEFELEFDPEPEPQPSPALSWSTQTTLKAAMEPPADEDVKPALAYLIEQEKAQLDLAIRRLEVQTARDKAIVARVKARNELMEHGVVIEDVDRLLPLDL